MKNEINILVLCDEIYKGLKAKGCGMAPVEAREGGFNGTFTNIIFQAVNEAKKYSQDF